MYIFAKFVTGHIFLQIRDKINIKKLHIEKWADMGHQSACRILSIRKAQTDPNPS
jgi:hypothetical protein